MQFYPYALKKTKRLSKDLFHLWLEPSDYNNIIPTPQPGQWVSVGFMDRKNNVLERRPYSLANRADYTTLEFLIKRRGVFSGELVSTRPGTTLAVSQPVGQFVVKPEMGELVFLAGGIGIAPFVSMLRSSGESNRQSAVGNQGRVSLFFSAKTKKEFILLPELRSLVKETGGVVVPTVTQQKPWFWNGEKGRIGIEMIKKYVPDSPSTYYFICGSKEFVGDLEGQLKAAGVDEKRIVKEKFF